MFGQIDHAAEIAICANFFSFQKTDKSIKIEIICHQLKNETSFSQEITRTSETYRRQNQSTCTACCAFLSRRARLIPWDVQKMCAVTILGTVLKPFRDYSLCSVCILPQPAFYSQSAVCILRTVCILTLVRSLQSAVFFLHWPIPQKVKSFRNTAATQELRGGVHPRPPCTTAGVW